MKTNMKLWVLAALGMVACVTASGQNAYKAFDEGEKISYDAYFNLGFIWVNAARAEFSVSNATCGKEKVWRLEAAGKTVNTFEKFYTVRDTFTSFVNKETLTPRYYVRAAHEGEYWAEDRFTFLSQSSKETSVKTSCLRKRGTETKTFSFDGEVNDMVTAIYKLRNFPNYDGLKVGDKVPFTIVYDDEGQKYDLDVRYAGRGTVKLKNGQKFRCIKLVPKVIKGKVFESEDAMKIWMTDDANHVPVYIEAKIKVGYLKAYYTGSKNLKYPLSSKVK